MPKRKASKKKTVAKKKKSIPRGKSAKKSSAKKAPPKTKKTKKASAKPVSSRGGLPDLSLPWRHPLPGETLAGVVDDYFSHIGVITFTLRKPLQVGDQIHVRGHTTDLTQEVVSLQIEHDSVKEAAVGKGVGIKVDDKCRRGDFVYLVE